QAKGIRTRDLARDGVRLKRDQALDLRRLLETLSRGRWIEKPMQMHDEIAHLRIVDRRLRLRFPGSIGSCVIREDADDIERIEILEFDALDARQLAAKDEMQELFSRG